jgi:tripartite-type tricarboxylate transporter receptor subunit TctC
MVGAGVLARSDPDGYTLGICSITTNSIPGLMYSKLPFDPASDFKLISGLWRLPNLLVVSKSLPVNSVPELIAYLKKNPGKYFFASSGQGTTTHLCGEMFKQQANVDIEHVPFRGGSQAVTAMLAGDVQIYFDNISGALPLVRDGRLKGLAVTSSERDVNAPEFPTMSETLPGFDVTSWCGVAGPAKIPSDVVTTLTKYTAEALKDEQLIRKFAEFGATVWPTTSEFITKYRNEEEARYRPVIEKVGIKLD